MTPFPILDASYAEANEWLNRVVLDYFGVIEPHIDELDQYVALPLRLVHDDAVGMRIEIGPYALGGADIERIRAAIRAYDEATGGPTQ